MQSMISSSLIFSSIPKPQFDRGFRNGVGATSIRRALVVRCSGLGDGEQSKNLREALSGLVDKQVEELLNREENMHLLEGLERASERVESAKRQLAEIERAALEAQLLRNYVDRLEARASEIIECQREITEARSMIEEAERSLLLDEEGGVLLGSDRERWESIKAALISALVGTLAALPICVTQVSSATQLILPLAVTFLSCALFGVTFRYTIRRDLDNFQLKTGTSAAFGVMKGLSELGREPPLEPNPESFFSHAFDGAVLVAQNLYVFVFSAVALDFCFKMKLLSPFPMNASAKND